MLIRLSYINQKGFLSFVNAVRKPIQNMLIPIFKYIYFSKTMKLNQVIKSYLQIFILIPLHSDIYYGINAFERMIHGHVPIKMLYSQLLNWLFPVLIKDADERFPLYRFQLNFHENFLNTLNLISFLYNSIMLNVYSLFFFNHDSHPTGRMPGRVKVF